MRSRALLLTLGPLAMLALPLAAHAGGIPFLGPIIPPGNLQQCAIGWAGLIIVINNIISLGITLAIVFVAPIMIAYSGFLLVVNPFNSGAKEKAKGIMLNTIVGIVIALAAWLIVDAIMAVLYNPSAVGATWSSLITGGTDPCIPLSSSLHQSQGQTSTSGLSSSGANGSSSGGSCTVAPSGNICDPAGSALSGFGAAVDQASEICYAESKGNPTLASDPDKMQNDPQHRSFSFGLFQINLTQHPMSPSLDCPAAFNGTNYSATVKNETLYTQCVTAAEDPSQNIAVADTIYVRDNASFHEWSTAGPCGIAFLDSVPVLAQACAILSTYD